MKGKSAHMMAEAQMKKIMKSGMMKKGKMMM
jgi:hypothetical protein